MKREQLTNVTTESIMDDGPYNRGLTTDQLCEKSAAVGMDCAREAYHVESVICGGYRGQFLTAGCYADTVIRMADRIIALRSQQVTP